MSSTLLPCPFCGGGAVKYKSAPTKGGKRYWLAGCSNELCWAEKYSFPLRVWNTRNDIYFYENASEHNKLVRELDASLNGLSGAAKQASLCDIVSQIKNEGWELVRKRKGD